MLANGTGAPEESTTKPEMMPPGSAPKKQVEDSVAAARTAVLTIQSFEIRCVSEFSSNSDASPGVNKERNITQQAI